MYLHIQTLKYRGRIIRDHSNGTEIKSKLLRSLSAKKRHQFYETQLGNEVEVEMKIKKDIQGFSTNYVKSRSPWNLNG